MTHAVRAHQNLGMLYGQLVELCAHQAGGKLLVYVVREHDEAELPVHCAPKVWQRLLRELGLRPEQWPEEGEVFTPCWTIIAQVQYRLALARHDDDHRHDLECVAEHVTLKSFPDTIRGGVRSPTKDVITTRFRCSHHHPLMGLSLPDPHEKRLRLASHVTGHSHTLPHLPSD